MYEYTIYDIHSQTQHLIFYSSPRSKKNLSDALLFLLCTSHC